MSDKQFIQQAISLATENVKVGGRPFGAVIVKNGQVIAHAVNQITATNDPTAHAELLAFQTAVHHKDMPYGNNDSLYTLLHSPPQNHLRVCAWRHLDRLLRKPDRHSGYMK